MTDEFALPSEEAPPEWNDVTRRIIRAAMEVHTHLGPGLIERLYELALVRELRRAGLEPRQQVTIPVTYKGESIGFQIIDLIVDDLVVLELKAVERVPDVHLAQLNGYLKLSDLPLGLLINFHALRLKDGIHRRINSRSSRWSRPRLSAPSA